MHMISRRAVRPLLWMFALLLAAAPGAGAVQEGGPTVATVEGPGGPVAPEPMAQAESPRIFSIQAVTVPVDGATLVARFLLPATSGPRPAAILLPGSRDSENLPGLAESLAERGIAVLDLSKRGVGGSTGNWRRETLEERAEDALAALALLRARPDVDPRRVGLVGHSQGGYVAPLVAAKGGAPAFVVLLAGPGEPVREQVLTHERIRSERAGAEPDEIERRLRSLDRKLGLASTFGGLCRGLRIAYVCGMVDHDPAPALESIDAPVLALFAEHDDMVPPDPNVALVREALERAGNPDVTIRVIPDACHTFMPQSGPLEPMLPGFAAGFVEAVTEWIEERVSEAPEAGRLLRGVVEEVVERGVEARREGGVGRGRILLPLPVAYHMPETGWAGGASVVHTRWLDGESAGARASTDEAAFVYTEKGQVMASVETSRYTRDAGRRISAWGGYSRFPTSFHGVGRDLPDAARERYTSGNMSGGVRLHVRVHGSRFVAGGLGVTRYRLLDLDPTGRLRDGTLPGSSGGSAVVVGLGAGLDTRDFVTAAASGVFVDVRVRVSDPLLLSDFRFVQLFFDARRYFALPAGHVLAAHAYAATGRGEIPFQELPMMGGAMIQRGYAPMRNRDRDLVAAQFEYRSPMLWRLGAVAFAGAGGIGHGLDGLRDGGFAHSWGGGARFALDRARRLNFRADYGIGLEGAGLYIGIGEAF